MGPLVRFYQLPFKDQTQWWVAENKAANDKNKELTGVDSQVPGIAYYHIPQDENLKLYNDRASYKNKFFKLEDFADTEASSLPYGAQRRLEIARALATKPCLLLLDEPAAGMNPVETEELMETIRLIRDKFDIAVLLIEHDMKLVMGVCEKITVLNFGQVLMNGTPEEVQNNPEVIKAYLGD